MESSNPQTDGNISIGNNTYITILSNQSDLKLAFAECEYS